jgi:hypothetical protein
MASLRSLDLKTWLSLLPDPRKRPDHLILQTAADHMASLYPLGRWLDLLPYPHHLSPFDQDAKPVLPLPQMATDDSRMTLDRLMEAETMARRDAAAAGH